MVARPLLFGALVALLGAPGGLRAWGSATHQWITREALRRVADHPAVARHLGAPTLRRALLGGAVAPDMLVGLIPLRGSRAADRRAWRGHRALKGRELADALVAEARHGAAWAAALGFACHQLQDERGDGAEGYPAQKRTVRYQNALLNEALLELLVVAEPDAPPPGVAVDARDLAALTRDHPGAYSAPELEAARATFLWGTALTRGFLRGLAWIHRNHILPGMAAHYADLPRGRAGAPGLEELVARTATRIQRAAERREAVGREPDRGEPVEARGAAGARELEETVAAATVLARPLARALGLTGTLEPLQALGVLRGHPVLAHLFHLWISDAVDFAAYRRATDQATRESLARRARRREARSEAE